MLLEFETKDTLIKIKPETLEAVKKNKDVWDQIVKFQNLINKRNQNEKAK